MIPRVAAEDWTTAVRRAPTSATFITPKKVCALKEWNNSINSGSVLNGLNPVLINSSPKKINPNPIIVRALVLLFSPFKNINVIAANPTIGSPYLPMLRAKSHPVIVVPILAPRITPRPCWRVRREALIKPIVITVLTDEDCAIPVTNIPIRIAIILLVVRAAKVFFNFSPAIFCIPEDIFSIP